MKNVPNPVQTERSACDGTHSQNNILKPKRGENYENPAELASSQRYANRLQNGPLRWVLSTL